MIHEKLYDRDTGVQTLLNAFDRVAKGTSELMVIAGASDIGKTALVMGRLIEYPRSPYPRSQNVLMSLNCGLGL
ncbi:hypothetical protein HRE53_17295 [Acaryochloris sp. 'Moss Beach']|uniref:hypothetical protein n=1 Tax=Acaryochloris sp. 'Moss Beach' TaxID=2740837 RepID=UPI001F44F470|nr:hypothetical protein [Acaryochloris sp. 'Moss Beach']UJB68303.1 hypothetical protein HRE53_17295 [Acaryochloris sp. 'Moss Beach']